MKKVLLIGIGLLALAGLVVGIVWSRHAADYRERIMPDVRIAEFAVGGMTPLEARKLLEDRLPSAEMLAIDISAAGQTWRLTWSMIGQAYDVENAVTDAYAIGRDYAWWLAPLYVGQWRGHTVELPVVAADPELLRPYIQRIAERLEVAPTEADLKIVNGSVIATPGQEGQRLRVDDALDRVLAALAAGETTVSLTLESVSPHRLTPEPAYSLAQKLLSQPFVLVIHDVLTGDLDQGGYYAEFSAPPEQVASWIHTISLSDKILLDSDRMAISTWLEAEVVPHLGEERAIDIEETALQIQLGPLRSGDHRMQARVRHPERRYVVRPGDTFYDIAFSFGFPQWQLERVNPDVDPNLLNVGQVLTIPSLDVLFPHPLVPGKRIEIDLPTQTLRAYEYDDLIFEFRISSGISTTPTLAGQFQILFKLEEAFARRWRLDMPYFMAFYAEGENFYNGIHELPITSYGVRLSRGVLGWPASYGCIILDVGDAEALYHWSDVGTLVRVHGVAPGTPFGQVTLADIAPLVPDE